MNKYYRYRKNKEENIFMRAVNNSSIVNIVVSLGLFLGGLLFLSYYFYIGFMPKLNNFTDFTYMLFAMAIVGTLVFLILISLFVFPAFFYSQFFDNEMKKIANKGLFTYSMSIIPMILMIYLSKEIWLTELSVISWLFYGGLLILGILIPSVCCRVSKSLSTKEKWEKILYVTAQAIGSSYTIVLIYIIFVLSNQTNILTNLDALVTFFLFSVVAIVINLFMVDTKLTKRLLFKTILAGVSFVILMLYFRAYAVIPSFVMNQFQLGNFMIKSITAKQGSCEVLSRLNTSNFVISSIDTENKTCFIKGEICILSSIGTTMLWQVDNNRTIRLLAKDFTGMERNIFNNKRCVAYRHATKVK